MQEIKDHLGQLYCSDVGKSLYREVAERGCCMLKSEEASRYSIYRLKVSYFARYSYGSCLAASGLSDLPIAGFGIIAPPIGKSQSTVNSSTYLAGH